MYRSLDADKIIETARLLGRRVEERFPASSLGKVTIELHAEAQQAAQTSLWLARPWVWIRVLTAAAILLMLGAVATTLILMNRKVEPFSSMADLVQGLDAAVNEIIVIGAATYFLVNLESRLKRARALKALHVLRSMAHIIDMHQLTKDPDRLSGAAGPDTASSPPRKMTPFELTRYLDYCTEMLAIISKIAALYVQRFSEPVTLAAVDEVQDLTGGLSQKIWQKIMILDRVTTPR